MTVLHNKGHWDRSNVVYADRRVVRYDKGGFDPAMEWIDYGLGALHTDVLDEVDADENDLAALYRALAVKAQLFGFEATERFFEIGTPAALEETTEFLVAARRRRLANGRSPAKSTDRGALDG